MVWKTFRETLGSVDDDDDEDLIVNEDPWLVLMEFARLNNFSLVDVFKNPDNDNIEALSRDEVIKRLEVN